MTGIVLTLVAPEGKLAAAALADAAGRLRRLSGDGVDMAELAPDTAADLLLPAAPDRPDLLAAIRQEFVGMAGLDVFVQPINGRRKKLLMADMDATMIVGETLDEIAAHLGIADKIVPITERAMRGELDFAAALDARVGLLKGAGLDVLEAVRDRLVTMAGAMELVRTMAAHGARCVLVSGGFDMYTGPVAGRIGFHAHHGNRLVIGPDMKVTGEVLRPVLDKDRKKALLLDEAAKAGIAPTETMAVGDGANDIPMLQAAGVGVGYHGKPAVQAATPFQVRHSDLTALLYLQGYSRRSWRAG